MRGRRSIFDIMREYMKELEQLTEEAIREAFERPSWNLESCSLEPLFNLDVTSDNVIITADMPFVKPETIKIVALDEDLIEISAEMKMRVRFEDFGICHRQGEFSSFHCRVPLPVPVELEKAKIRVKKGIIEIKLPRRRWYRIEVE